MNVVFITLTPLAGAPIRIANALNKYTNYNVRVIDYNPNLYGARTFPEDLVWGKNKEECIELISKADILHFHHFFDVESENNPFNNNFKQLAPKAKIIRHFHTNLEQLSLWLNVPAPTIINDPYPRVVIPHCSERTLLDTFIVPNIIPINDEILIPKETSNKIQKVFFSASSSGSMWDARWDTKGLPEVVDKFNRLSQIENFYFELVQNTPYRECQKLKQNCDIVIGDTTSGSYHLTDLEALSQGKPTFSYLDNRSQMTLQNLLQCDDLPFINSRLEEIDLPFLEVLKNKDLQKEIGSFSRAWIEKYYNEQKLTKFFEEAYEKVLNNEPLKRQGYLEFSEAKKFLYNDLYDLQWETRKKQNYIPPKENKKNKLDLQNIFSVKNENRNGVKRKVINFLGIKIKIKVKNKKFQKKYNFKIINNGENNQIFLIDKNKEKIKLTTHAPIPIEISGNNNLCIIPADAVWLDSKIVMRTNNSSLFWYNTPCLCKIYIEMNHGNKESISIDENFSIGGGWFYTLEEGAKINIGKDCMFSTDICLLSGDVHTIKDKNTKDVINFNNSGIEIGNHVWLGKYAKVTKNSYISDNCIVGINALVSGRFDEQNAILAGIPAKVIKKDIIWERTPLSVYKKQEENMVEVRK